MTKIQSLCGSVIEADLTWTGERFESGIRIVAGTDGLIVDIGSHIPPESVTVRLQSQALLPGMVNAHSHAFHRALRNVEDKGNSEKGLGSFWTWRESMYSLAETLTSDAFYTICKQAFEEMLASGITTVGEFHYFHHSKNGGRAFNYDFDRTILKAANDAGIRIVLLEAFYEQAGLLPGQTLAPAQHRFVSQSLDEFWRNFDLLATQLDSSKQSLGIAAHSVRAVKLPNIVALHAEARKRKLPFHIHLEEQLQEIDDCVKIAGKTPSELLLSKLAIDENSTLVHCTHTPPESLSKLIKRGANICICPITEANLADGIFNWSKDNGNEEFHYCLGTDCNIRICFAEEMRWLLFAQQLKHMKRGLPNGSQFPAVEIFNAATFGGAKALGLSKAGNLEKGNVLDFFTIDLRHDSLRGWTESGLLHSFMFGAASDAVVSSACVGGMLHDFKGVLCPAAAEPTRLKVTSLYAGRISTNGQRPDFTSVGSLTKALMAITSTTGDEKTIVVRLSRWLKERGWHVLKQEIPSEDQAEQCGRENLFVTKNQFTPNSSKGPRLILNSHTDTVPPQIEPTIDSSGQVLKGRGACDAKGQIAAMIIAAEAFSTKHPEKQNDIGLLFVVGEEVDHIGMKEASKLGLAPDFLICGEPTELKLAKRQKGIVKAKLIATGKPAHSGYPEKGESAVHMLLAVLGELQNASWPASAELGSTTLNIGMIKGGEAANVFAGNAEATIMFRVVTSATETFRQLEQIVANRVEVELITQNDPVEFATLPGFEQSIVAFNTDVPYFRTSNANMRAFLYGAGSITDAHGENEHVRIADLEQAVKGYQEIMDQLLL